MGSRSHDPARTAPRPASSNPFLGLAPPRPARPPPDSAIHELLPSHPPPPPSRLLPLLPASTHRHLRRPHPTRLLLARPRHQPGVPSRRRRATVPFPLAAVSAPPRSNLARALAPSAHSAGFRFGSWRKAGSFSRPGLPRPERAGNGGNGAVFGPLLLAPIRCTGGIFFIFFLSFISSLFLVLFHAPSISLSAMLEAAADCDDRIFPLKN
ncbi:hypothetical protein PVAP13_9KG314671 [Panicum virgatum]|uniref:Uncharacterized protein n=1 Tax=Panicum virgatum TaxID=38727 RepID=A0A8T0NQI6_PANVG|nr:hypothetical protein PVAP13_9KG314671 [Panicum virgatum]